jgi:hypothetical protein
LWLDPRPTAPWAWRQQEGEKRKTKK